MIKEILSVLVVVAAMAAIAAGRVPGLRMNRAAIAFAAAALLVAIGAIPLKDAFAAIDLGTIVLLLSMMVLVAAIRLSGLFDVVASRLAGLAGYPRGFLGAIVIVAGMLSALFMNDTMCLVLAPVVAETSLRAGRNPTPYLAATAIASNVGSAATIIGNPQNMLIGARSGVPFSEFAFRLAPPALIGLVVCWLVVQLAFPGEFRRRGRAVVDGRAGRATSAGPLVAVRLDKTLAVKCAIASAAMLLGFIAGVPVALAAMLPAALMLASTRLESERLLSGVDFNLLVFFGGLFVITDAAARTVAFAWLERTALTGAATSPWLFASATAAVSNVVSNVPAVMMLSPIASCAADPRSAWLLLAMASTFAGNLTLIGSVANLIVAEGAASRGARLGFVDYLKAGLPVTLITLAIGTAWLAMTAS
ncbi:MAG TPA: anion transporter [Spirochaetales bacterium]|nr:anion transporter [Spirochaetales bacterium]HPM71393.1 anion transporter [Spirochaetales bacterium]